MTDRLTYAREFYETYSGLATQLNTRALAGGWIKMGVSPQEAARWANAGYRPDEAAPLIAAKMTPEMASAGDPDSVEEGIARLADAGIDTTGVDLRHLP